jgi:transcriptional regulator with XRE-family HTH domain
LNNRKPAKRVTKPNPRSTGSLDVHFGEKLRARRLMMVPKLSQEELGDALGITFKVQKYEKGVNRISAATMVQIAAVLRVDVQYFLKNSRPAQRTPRRSRPPSSSRCLLLPMALA